MTRPFTNCLPYFAQAFAMAGSAAGVAETDASRLFKPRPKSGCDRGLFRRRVPGCLPLIGLLLFSQGLRCPAASVANYFVRVWQVEEGLPQNSVTSVIQTGDGFIWAGTYNGLVRFDGVRFKVFDSENTRGISSSEVTSLFEAGDGSLMIGHAGGGLTRFKSGRFESLDFHANWPSPKISSMAEDESGELWLANGEGLLARVRDGETRTPPAGPGKGLVRARAINARGSFLVWRNGVASALQHGELKALNFGGASPENYVRALCPARDGGLWVIINGQIQKWLGEKCVADWGAVPWGEKSVSSMMETSSGLLAAGTPDLGLFLISSPGQFLHFTRTNGLPNDWVESLCEDHEGNLWAGTHGGLVMFRQTAVSTMNPPDQWQGRAVMSVCPGREGALWVSTEGSGIYRLKDAVWTHFSTGDGLTSPYVWSVAEDVNGRLWGGTWDHGAFVQQGDHFEPVPEINSDLSVLALLHLQEGEWLAGSAAGLLHYDKGLTNRLAGPGQFLFPDIRCILKDPDGKLWFGTHGGGLGSYKDGDLRQFRRADGLPSDFVQCLRREADGNLWIGTSLGLARLKNGGFSTIGEEQGLPGHLICDIEEDAHGFFWISSEKGIMRAGRAELNRCADGLCPTVQCRLFGMNDGLPTVQCSGGLQPAGCKTPDGRMWFPTIKGLVAVDPEKVTTNQIPPPVVIEETRTDDRVVVNQPSDSRPLEVPPGRHQVEFCYTGLSLADPGKVLFKYRLAGLDKEWINAAGRRVANYNYIPPGRYVFQVIACNNDGVWNETGAKLAFTVLPYFWQTTWFRVSGGILTLMAGGGIAWLDTRRRMRVKLEHLERQNALERERTRIAKDIHDDLGVQLTRIGMLSDPSRIATQSSDRSCTDLKQIHQVSSALTRAIDEIVWAVNPQHDTLDSLVNYLHKFAQDFLETTAIRCRLDAPIPLPCWHVSGELRHNLFLAFKEAVNNIVKHANATEVHISMELQPAAFSLTVEDNGKGLAAGISPAQFGGRNGFRNMKQRMADVGGLWEVSSVPGQGTKITFVLPKREPEL